MTARQFALHQYVLSNPVLLSDYMGLHAIEACCTSSASRYVTTSNAMMYEPSKRRLQPGDPGYWDGPPDCSDPNWCFLKLHQRLTRVPGVMKCFGDMLAIEFGVQTAACILGCSALAVFPEACASKIAWAACITACGADVAIVTSGFAACFSKVRHYQEDAENSYCACLQWKERRCKGQPGNTPEIQAPGIKCGTKYKWPGMGD